MELDSMMKVIAFICDAPVRAFLRCMKGHNAYYSFVCLEIIQAVLIQVT